MPLIDQLENKLGRFAIPGLVTIIAGLQAAVWLLLQLQPGMAEDLILDRTAVLHGQFWRLFTWALIPPVTSVIWLFFTVMIMFTMSDGLDRAWGAFRVNLYLFGSIAFVAVGVMLFGTSSSVATGQYIYWTLFLAFAVFYPEFEFLLFYILPFKVKYLAMILGGLILLTFIDTAELRLTIILSMMSFFIGFGGQFIRFLRQKGKVTVRRAQYERAKAPEMSTLHHCHGCGKTEKDDPTLDFRVGPDGEDYCNKCRAQRAPN